MVTLKEVEGDLKEKLRIMRFMKLWAMVNLDSNFSEPGEADAMLTFRNLRNWIGPQLDAILNSAFLSLKPGGYWVLSSTELLLEPASKQ